MKNKLLFPMFLSVIILLLSWTASALANCAVESYTKSCSQCSFDKNGKMDKNCYELYKNKGRVCVARNYPLMAAKYPLGLCPALDACIDNLKACSGYRCIGPDSGDCTDPFCESCYEEADRCAARAAKDCDAKAECGNKKCEKDAGETDESCCTDCGCAFSLECDQNKCKVKQTGECTRTEMSLSCMSTMTETQCAMRGKMHYTERNYKNVELACCLREKYGDIESLKCYFNGEEKDRVDLLLEDAETDFSNICLGAVALPMVAVSGLILLELPAFLRRWRI